MRWDTYALMRTRAILDGPGEAQGGGDDFDKVAVYYAATAKALMVSLNEERMCSSERSSVTR